MLLRAVIAYRYVIPRALALAGLTPGLLLLSGLARQAFLAAVAGLLGWLIRPDPHVAGPPPTKRRGVASDRFAASKLPEAPDAVVIGSGAGGLTCAAALSQMGWRVLVLEKHETVAGGGTHEFPLGSAEDHFKFDAGLHYTVPWSQWVLQLVCNRRAAAPRFSALDEGDGTFDRVVVGRPAEGAPLPGGFCYKRFEAHLPALRAAFPDEGEAIDRWIELSDRGMIAVCVYGVYVALPGWLQPAWQRLAMSGPLWHDAAMLTAEQVLEQRVRASPKLAATLLGLWIDCGVPPTRGSFMLAAAVNRGLAMEGAVYPEGGSESIAKALVPVIEAGGGRCLIRAPVEEIRLDGAGRVAGVALDGGREVESPVVVGACGSRNTGQLLPEAARAALELPASLAQSDGFLMCNVGIDGGAAELGLKCSNVWVHPLGPHNGWDLFRCIREFEADPEAHEPPMMITFPSIKDRSWAHPNKTTAQLLVLAKLEWFGSCGEPGRRTKAYEELKARWGERCLAILLRHYPQLEGRVKLLDVSTPASVGHWLASPGGAATGLECVPARFEPAAQAALQMRTRVDGLWLTGQDAFICGVPMAQIAGLITALRIAGPWASAEFAAGSAHLVLRAALLGL